MATFKTDWPISGNDYRVSGQPPKVRNGIISDFGRRTTIHGVRHFTNKRNHLILRLLWAAVSIVSLFICFNLLINVWTRWNEGPIFVGLADKTESIRNVPFPAVTICPETKAKTTLFNFTAAYHLAVNHSLPAENITYMEAIAQICDTHMAKGIGVNATELTDDTIFSKLDEIAQTASDVLFFCKWRNTATPCQPYFKKIWTEEGRCFTFNLMESDEIFTSSLTSDVNLISKIVETNDSSYSTWSLADGYNHLEDADGNSDGAYPYHSYGAGLRGGLNVLLRLYEHDLDYMCRGPVQGFKVLLHLPNEIPQISSQFFRVPLNKETFVSINPRVTTSGNSLKYHDADVRGCYYNHERSLKYFQEYTQNNCELECLTNITLNKCGCVKFSMPRESDTPICGVPKIPCYTSAADELLKFNGYTSGRHPDATNDCNCLPSCTSISYDHEISQADFDYKSLFNAFKSPLSEFPGMMNARLTITFKENHFVALKRHELYNHVDLLAICGGILALFFGASLFSFLELIHYFSLKLLFRGDPQFGVEEHILNDHIDQ